MLTAGKLTISLILKALPYVDLYYPQTLEGDNISILPHS